MSIKTDFSGLKKLAQNAKEIDGTHSVELAKVLSPSFMASHTSSRDFDSFCELGGFKVESAEDFAAIPDQEWEDHVMKNTKFPSWLEMQKTAAAEYMKAQLFKGIK